MHPLQRDLTVDTSLSPFAGGGACESQEGVTLPWQTGSAMVVTYSAPRERHDPRTPHFWLLASPDRSTPIRHGLSTSVVEESVREILRVNISKLVWADAYRPIISDFPRSPAHEVLESLIASLGPWIAREFATLIEPIGPENAAGGATPISTEEPEVTRSQPHRDPLSLDWVQALSRDGRQTTSREAFMNMMNALEDLLAQRNFGLLDELLASVDYSKISPEVMVAFVRTTYQARSKLRAWPSAVQKIKNELTRRSFDGSRVLMGLLS